jgi:hypothetical protein
MSVQIPSFAPKRLLAGGVVGVVVGVVDGVVNVDVVKRRQGDTSVWCDVMQYTLHTCIDVMQ